MWESPCIGFGQPSSIMAIEDLDLFLKGQSFHNLDIDFIPSRCGSAPPSMEGSRTAVESIFTKWKSTLNPRLVYQNISTRHFVYSKNSLPVQEEELEEDLSSEQSFLQEDSHKTSSLLYDKWRHKSSEKVVSDADSRFYKKETTVPQNNVSQVQAASHDGNTPQFQRPYTQIIYPGINHAYGSFNQFHYNSPIASTSVQPLLHSSGFTHPLYTAAALSNSSSPFYPNLHPPSFFPSQCGISGYTFNYPVLPVYMAGNPYRAVPVVFNSNSFPISRISNVGNLHGQKMPLPYMHSPSGYNNLNFGRGHVSSNYSFGDGGSPGASVATNQCGNDMNAYSLLEDLKNGKGQRLELYDISGYIREFSFDQHGSRFIQQRLETCSVEEKASVFKEVVPHASQLMTDAFGNYVIQKLFEYGSAEQRKDLADQLQGQVVPLTLHMYGCRVIQKALEFVDLEQKTRLLVRELNGHVTRCVHDQNGNHVIQKCIEKIPSYNIHFIISSFRGQVATLSMHPYGCRVIQRVLEHCKDELQTQFIVDEILDSVSSLAQDQYGNYVLQHVLERSKAHERKEIIEKLCNSIVQLSQNKFASNVIEKCLEYSDSSARDMLIEEIIGHGDKNDNLWTMMKDQYANYVVQKILQKCTSDQRKMLLGLVRNHLTPLKKYTHGKHIAARFEELYGEGKFYF